MYFQKTRSRPTRAAAGDLISHRSHGGLLEARLTDPDSGQVWTGTMDAVSLTTTL